MSICNYLVNIYLLLILPVLLVVHIVDVSIQLHSTYLWNVDIPKQQQPAVTTYSIPIHPSILPVLFVDLDHPPIDDVNQQLHLKCQQTFHQNNDQHYLLSILPVFFVDLNPVQIDDVSLQLHSTYHAVNITYQQRPSVSTIYLTSIVC